MGLEMLLLFQKVKSIRETVVFGILKQTYKIYNHTSLYKVFYKRILFTHSYLTVFLRTAIDARSKIKIHDTLLSQKRYVQSEVMLSL